MWLWRQGLHRPQHLAAHQRWFDDADRRDRRPQDWRQHQGQDWLRDERPGHPSYCEQVDVHSETSTFREASTFSAFLKQDSSVPVSKKFDSVDWVLDVHHIAD
jgi:hypothetical protein